jgi:hypothetical protein
MKVVISNKSKIGLGKVVVDTHNKVTKVNFSRVAKVSSILLNDLADVSVVGQKNGDVLVFDANTNNYIIETIPNVDGGIY